MKKKETINKALLNMISPIGLEFWSNKLRLGEHIGKVLAVVKYNPEQDYGWLSKITNIPGTIMSISYKPIPSGDFLTKLNSNISQQRGIERDAKDALKRNRAKRAADDGEILLKEIDEKGESVGLLSTVIMPFGSDKDSLENVNRKLNSVFLNGGNKLRVLADMQKEGLEQISPMYTINSKVKKIADRIVPLSTIMGGFPNASSGFNDNHGYYFANDGFGGKMFIDFWMRNGDRTNSNFVIMGIQGQGKSTAVKHLAISEYMMGTKIIFTDPDREYKYLTHKLGGYWVNVGGGSKGRINPLEIRPIPKDDDEDDAEYKFFIDEGQGVGDLALYIKHLEVFFSLYLESLSDIEKALLKDVLIELYHDFNITWDTDTSLLKPTDYPIFTDLHNKLTKKSLDKSFRYSEIYEKLALLLKDATYGSDSAMWNGYTTIRTDSRCICFDTNELQNTPNNVKKAQNYNINSLVWQIMSRDRNEKVLALYDEAYLNIDPQVPQSLVHLRNSSKRARKYESGIGIISHSVVDFLDPSVKMYGQSLLDSPCYKIIFGCDGPNLKDVSTLYKLTENEIELLESKRQRHALMMIGSKRMHVNFEIPEYKFEYFGSAGGR